MKKDFAILLVDSAQFYADKNMNTKRKHADENHQVSVYDIEKDRSTAEAFFAEEFSAEAFTGYVGKKSIRKINMDYGIRLTTLQDMLEEIKTIGYMFIYVLPVLDKRAPEYTELQEEIETRVAYGCFADIIVAGGLEVDDISENILEKLAEHLREVIR
ncbi:MAG: hypothetical protein IKV96_03920 [Firmicutes bacterium]|nr:hypothetical protein [Bacillota bacterium]